MPAQLWMGLTTVLEPVNFVGLLFGTMLGIIFGAIPGLNSITAVILVLPFCFGMDPNLAFIILTTAYCGALYAGSIPAILFKTPGTSAAIMTVMDGYPAAQKGRAGEALATAAIASATGGFVSAIILILLGPSLADIALTFAPPEYFAVAVFGLSAITSLGTKNQVKSLISMFLGILIATVGIDTVTGMERFTFGNAELMSGFELVPVVTGLFALSEVLRQAQFHWGGGSSTAAFKVSAKMPPWSELWRLKGTIARGTAIGTLIGGLPGEGATVAVVLAYNEERRWSKHPEKFGTGVLEGIAAPESANNAVSGGAMIPTLALGIPGSPTTAALMGVFWLVGITPGPTLFIEHPQLVNAIFMSMVLANVMILVVGILGVRQVARVIEAPYSVIAVVVVMFCFWGTYSIRNNLWDVGVMIGFALVGYFLVRYHFPPVALILGMILGPLAEPAFIRSMLMLDGNVLALFSRPISAALLALSIIVLLYPSFVVLRQMARRSQRVRTEPTTSGQ